MQEIRFQTAGLASETTDVRQDQSSELFEYSETTRDGTRVMESVKSPRLMVSN